VEQVGQRNDNLELGINARVFQGIIGVMHTITDEAELRYSSEGLTVKIVDPAHVCMMDIEIPSKAFSIWSMGQGFDTLRIGLNIDDMKHLLKAVKKDDMLNMSFTEDQINISVGNVEATLKNQDCSNMLDPKIPALTLPGQYDINISDMYEAIRQCGNVADNVKISLNNEDIIFSSVNEELKQSTKLKFLNNHANDGIVTSYPLDYMKDHYTALKKMDKKAISHIDMGTDYPMRSETLFNDDIRITYLLAPRIETD